MTAISIVFSCNIIRVIKSRRMRWAEHAARMAKMRNEYKILVRKPEGRRPLERPRRRWEDNTICILGKSVGKVGLVSSGSG
jgi:hypothetical protein